MLPPALLQSQQWSGNNFSQGILIMSNVYHHGTQVFDSASGAQPLQSVSTSAIGIIATADDADATVFPLNRPTLISQPSAISSAGTTGTLAKTLNAIFGITSPQIVVVRVPHAADAAAQDTAAIGAMGAQNTGMQALLSAQAAVGVKPRIIGAPGLDTLAVATALPSICDKLRAFCYCAGVGAHIPDVLTYRPNFSSKRQMLIWPDFTLAGASIEASALALGLRSWLDDNVGWHKTISNVPINNVDGISADVFFDLVTAGTDADTLNLTGITTLIRQTGFRFWGSRTCSADANFVFESATRTGDFLADIIGQSQFEAVDKPMSTVLFDDIVLNVNAEFSALASSGKIVGARAWLDKSLNSSANLNKGIGVISYNYTPCPPLEDLQFMASITDSFLVNLVN
jgi:uncharacterized protein